MPCAVTNSGHGVHYLKCIHESENRGEQSPLSIAMRNCCPSEVKISPSVWVHAAHMSPRELPSTCACTERAAWQVQLELASPFLSKTSCLSTTASCWVLLTWNPSSKRQSGFLAWLGHADPMSSGTQGISTGHRVSGQLGTTLAQLQGGQEDMSYALLCAGECRQVWGHVVFPFSPTSRALAAHTCAASSQVLSRVHGSCLSSHRLWEIGLLGSGFITSAIQIKCRFSWL